jgi:hypothetical protein
MIGVLEGAAATHGNKPWVSVLGEDDLSVHAFSFCPTLSALTRYPVRAQLMRRTLGTRIVLTIVENDEIDTDTRIPTTSSQ